MGTVAAFLAVEKRELNRAIRSQARDMRTAMEFHKPKFSGHSGCRYDKAMRAILGLGGTEGPCQNRKCVVEPIFSSMRPSAPAAPAVQPEVVGESSFNAPERGSRSRARSRDPQRVESAAYYVGTFERRRRPKPLRVGQPAVRANHFGMHGRPRAQLEPSNVDARRRAQPGSSAYCPRAAGAA